MSLSSNRASAYVLPVPFEQCPVQTPLNTGFNSPRVGSPFIAPHTNKEAAATMHKLNTLSLSRSTPGHDASVADGSATVPAWSKCKYLAVYFIFNLGLTLYNKAVMVQVCLEFFAIVSCVPVLP